MSIDNFREVPNRQSKMLDGNESELYDIEMQPYKKPYATDETQMLNLNQVDALNISPKDDIVVEMDSVPVDDIIQNDTNAGIPVVEVRGASDGSKAGTS